MTDHQAMYDRLHDVFGGHREDGCEGCEVIDRLETLEQDLTEARRDRDYYKQVAKGAIVRAVTTADFWDKDNR